MNNNKIEVNKDNILQAAKDFLEKEYKYRFNSEYNAYEFEVYLDYRDNYIETDTLKKLIADCETVESMKDKIYEHLNDCFMESVWNEKDYITNEITKYLETVFDPDDLIEFDIAEIIKENELFYVDVDYERILNNSTVDVTIFYENEEAFNHEFGFNNFYPSLSDWLENIKESIEYGELEENDISIFKLIKSQGYTIEQFENAIAGEFEDPFLDNLLNEIANTTSGCNSYVFLKSMNFNEYMELFKKDTITIDKNITSGLVSFVYGGGSILGIELKNDITLEKGEYTLLLDGQYGYGVNEIYGQFG